MTNLGRPAYPRPKGTGDHNLPETRGQAKSAPNAPQDPRGKVKGYTASVQSRSGHASPGRFC